MLAQLIADFGIGILYIALALKGGWYSHSVGTTGLRLTFFFCGAGHLMLSIPPLHPLHLWVDFTTMAVAIPTVYLLLTRQEKVILVRDE